MRFSLSFSLMACLLGMALAAHAEAPSPKEQGPKQLQVTADQSLEYYADKRLYVARGNAKAVRGTLTVTADVLTAHEREKPQGAAQQPKSAAGDKSGAGDIDVMTAEGHVVISDPRQRITGEHAVYDLDKHKMIVTGDNLRYETAKEVVTAKDSLEYYEDAKLAVARGHAVADQPTRHIEADVLTAEFRDAPNGQSQLTRMTAEGHVTVITKSSEAAAPANGKVTKGGDVSRGDRAVYDAGSNMAVLSGGVHITRKDGTELSGDVGEVNFNNNQNRLLNDGSGRVKALLPEKTTDAAKGKSAP
jgi:lipopolysaccharide export system protein LptA